MTDFLVEYEQLAAEIAEEARRAEALGDRIDAFKALTPFYLQKTKGKKAEAEDNDGFDFSKFQLETEQQDGSDKPGVRGSRRNGN